MFPQAIGLAATWNRELIQQVGTVVSTEARAKFNLAGGPGKDHRRYEGLTIWSPNINIFRDPRWGRGQETYGEDPYLAGQLGVAFVRGLQGDDALHPRTIATPKHFAVHSGPEPGRHGFSVAVSPRDLEATYTPAFRAAVIEGGAGSVMCAYNALHGAPACAAGWFARRAPARRLGFHQARSHGRDHLPENGYSVRWTGDLLPPGPGEYTLAVRMARCFDCSGHDPVRLYVDDRLVVAGDATGKRTTAVAHDAGEQSLETVLRFDGVSAHRIRLELEHRGEDQGLRLEWIAPPEPQLAEAERALAQADAVAAFVGLSPDVEGEALQIDVPGFDGGDRNDIALPAPQRALLERAKASGKPLVVVLMSGSAVALTWAQQHADAILAAWYPGQAGGTAIARVLAGDDNPGGRLPVTFYRSTRDLPPYVGYDMKGRTYRYFTGKPLYPFGHGLAYTHFAYDAPRLSTPTLKAGETLRVIARVRNAGARAGDEVVQVYLEYPDRPLSPGRALVDFARVALRPGESRELTFELDARRLSDVDRAGKRAVMEGDYRIFVGGGQPDSGAPGGAATFAIEGRAELPR